MTARPWRAVAYLRVGDARITVARTARSTRARLTPWLEEQRAAGYAIDWWQVQPIPEVAAAAQASARAGE